MNPTPILHRSAHVMALLALVVGSGACTRTEAAQVTIGVGSTDEQRVLAALSLASLEHAGIMAEAEGDLGDTVALRERALEGEVDLYWDYTGAAWALGLGGPSVPAGADESFEAVAEEDRAQGLEWLPPSEVDATLALFVRPDELPDPASGTLTWLAGQLSAGGRALCADAAFAGEAAGYASLAEAYSIQTDRVQVIEVAEAEAVALTADGTCFAGLATATSGAAAQAGLVRVADDQGVFPAFIAAPVVRADTLEAVPGVAPALARVTDRLTTDLLAALTARVMEGEDPADVAAEVLGTA